VYGPEEWLWIDSNIEIKNIRPIEVSFGSAFSVICNHCRVMAAGSLKTLKRSLPLSRINKNINVFKLLFVFCSYTLFMLSCIFICLFIGTWCKCICMIWVSLAIMYYAMASFVTVCNITLIVYAACTLHFILAFMCHCITVIIINVIIIICPFEFIVVFEWLELH